MVVEDLHDEGTGVRLQAAVELDVGARVDDGVGDELADHDHGVVGLPVGEELGSGQGEFGPFGERGP